MTGLEFIETAETLLGPLSEVQKERFLRLEALYRDWNEKINVISRKDIDGLYPHHVLHSLAVAGYMKSALPADFAAASGKGSVGVSSGVPSVSGVSSGVSGVSDCVSNASSVAKRLSFLDVGTGGGFPGIPLAILFENADFTLCDSIGKKITVARDVAAQLGLQNVTVVNARAESLPGKYDYVVSRAVTGLDNFIPWVRRKYDRGILCLKGGEIAEEIAVAMGKFRLKRGSVHSWPIESWTHDPYFEGKYVIRIDAQ